MGAVVDHGPCPYTDMSLDDGKRADFNVVGNFRLRIDDGGWMNLGHITVYLGSRTAATMETNETPAAT